MSEGQKQISWFETLYFDREFSRWSLVTAMTSQVCLLMIRTTGSIAECSDPEIISICMVLGLGYSIATTQSQHKVDRRSCFNVVFFQSLLIIP
jgi:hypothetical protein